MSEHPLIVPDPGTPSTVILATINYQGCDPKTVGVPSSTLNELAVYTSTNAAYPDRYSFGVSAFGAAAGGADTVTLSCGGSPMEIPVSFISSPVAPCYTVTPMGSDLPSFADEKQLEDSSYSSICGSLAAVSGSWSFAQ